MPDRGWWNGYRAFWPTYVGEHRAPAARRLHFAGTSLALGCLALGVVWEPWLLACAAIAGYGPAWAGHFFIERNRPATFRHPVYSLIGDLHMYGLMWAGRMGKEVERLRSEGRIPTSLRSSPPS